MNPQQQLNLLAQLHGLRAIEAQYSSRKAGISKQQSSILLRCWRTKTLNLPNARNNLAAAIHQLEQGDRDAALAALRSARKSLDF